MKTLYENPYIKGNDKATRTGVITMEHQKHGTTVDLIGAIHIGSPLYYQKVLSLLQENDIVLYEMCGIGKASYTFKKYFLFVEKIGLRKFYKEIANASSHYFNKKIEQELLPSLDRVIKLLDKNEKISGDKIFAELKNSTEEMKMQNEKEKSNDRLSVVCQSDAINYDHLPNNRKHADLTKQELYSTMKVFSSENVSFFGLWVLLPLLRKLGGIDIMAKAIVTGKLDSAMLPIKKSKGNLHQKREEKIYDLIQLYEKSVESIGVFYGAGHLPAIEAHLQSKGYVTKDVNYIEAIRNKSEDIEKDTIA